MNLLYFDIPTYEHPKYRAKNADPAGVRTKITWCKDKHVTFSTTVTSANTREKKKFHLL